VGERDESTAEEPGVAIEVRIAAGGTIRIEGDREGRGSVDWGYCRRRGR
jgi:hypothetical protein